MKIISVIIPCYNVEKYIDRCLESVVNQSIGLEAMEIICVDDCSTDGTLSKLMEWEARYPESFMVVESPQNGRQGQARNIGLTYASTDWIAFLDSDDWIDLNYVEVLYSFARTGKYDLVCCGHIRDAGKNLSSKENKSNEKIEYRELIIENDEQRKQIIMNAEFKYSAWAKLISKDILLQNNLTFPENLTYEDACWGALLHMYVNAGVIIDKQMYHYFVNDVSTILTANSNHHLDCITTQSMLWEEWEKRGFLEKYREALEIEHIYSAYLAGIKMLILRYETPNYNGYLLLRYLILQRIPDYEKNIYIQNGILHEKYMLALTALKHQLNKQQFMEFAENMKKIGI